MAGDDRIGYKENWKSIDSLMNEAESKRKPSQQKMSEGSDVSPFTTADFIQLDDILLKGGLNEL